MCRAATWWDVARAFRFAPLVMTRGSNLVAARTASVAKRRKGKGRKVSKAEKARLLAVAAVDEGRARKKAAENVAPGISSRLRLM